MKKITSISLLAVFVISAAGQNAEERVMLFTDRSLYISGENILFSALVSPSAGSSILYCEIVTQKGSAVGGGKFNIVNSVCSGSIEVPKDLVTGVYFFRAYTKFMRNEGPASFSYLPVTLVNPYLNEVLSTGAMDNLQINRGIDLPDFVKILPDKKIVKSGDSVHVSWHILSPQLTLRNVSVAVIPDNLPSYSPILLPVSGFEKVNFVPEINGPSVTGRVKENTGGKTNDAVVNLSVLGKGHDFMSTKPDSAGYFSFYLRGYTGYRDLFFCISDDSAGRQIIVDNDFCTAPVTLPPIQFSVTDEERRAVYRMALNVQVDSLFHPKPSSETSATNDIEDAYFYGTPDETIKIDNYVQLPTLEDYFNELPTLVKVRKSGGQKYFRILGDQTGLSEFQPLVMIDLVGLNDPARILGISPQDIDRIEVINSFYVKGDQVYGGIVNLISKKGDFAGIDLPSSGVFVRYRFPVQKTDGIKNTGQQPGPDSRNTVLWIPHLNLQAQSIFSFTAPSTPGRYIITMKGVAADGNEFFSSESFDVE